MPKSLRIIGRACRLEGALDRRRQARFDGRGVVGVVVSRVRSGAAEPRAALLEERLHAEEAVSQL